MTNENCRLPGGAIRAPHAVLVWRKRAAALALACAWSAAHAGAPRAVVGAADIIYRNGYVYTVDAGDSVQQALPVRAGRIIYVGDNTGAARLAGKRTRIIDLQGRMLMPGLIDAHMHPLSGGKRLLHCNLNYEALTVPQFQARIQACVDKESRSKGVKEWLQVVNWFEQGMLPAGVETTRATLDTINTARPVVVRSSFGHSNLVNTRGLEVAGITRATPNPATGKIVRDAAGEPTGLLEDAAMELVDKLLPKTTPAENISAATFAMQALGRQGVTSFFDASSDQEIFTAFAAIERQGKLSARAHFAAEVATEDGADPARALASVLKMVKRYHQGQDRRRAHHARAPRQALYGWRDRRAGPDRHHAGALLCGPRHAAASALGAGRQQGAADLFPARRAESHRHRAGCGRHRCPRPCGWRRRRARNARRHRGLARHTRRQGCASGPGACRKLSIRPILAAFAALDASARAVISVG